MNQHGINPYQPIELPPATSEEELPCEIAFHLTHAYLRHAEAQYLLHWHPGRLLFGSLAMIAVSCVVFWWAMRFGPAAFAIALPAAMVLSSLIYLALVHVSKNKIRRRLREHGLVDGAACTVFSDREQLLLTTPGNHFRWSKDVIKVHRTRKGLLLCPEPYLFVFVPTRNGASPTVHASLIRSLG